MVRTIKKWLGITALERENLTLAKTVAAHTRRIEHLESESDNRSNIMMQMGKSIDGHSRHFRSNDESISNLIVGAQEIKEIALDCQVVYKDHETRLQSIEVQPKATEARPKSKTVSFRQFKAAAESLPEE